MTCWSCGLEDLRMTDTDQDTLQPASRKISDPRQRLLKGLVIFMGVLLVAGFAVVIATITYRIQSGDEKGQAQPAAQSAPVAVDMPEGAHIEDILQYRGELALLLAFPDGHQAIMILDPESGSLIPLAEFE